MSRPRQISDAQIVDAARKAFFERGPKAPVSLVALKLGVSQAALFHRVGTKQQLMTLALGPRPPPVIDELEKGPEPGALRPQLTKLLSALIAFHRQVVPGLMVLRTSDSPMQRPPGLPAPVLVRRLLAGWLARAHATHGVAIERPLLIADTMLGTLEARSFNSHLGGSGYAPGSDTAAIRGLIKMFIPGEQR
jgi:AcrR family transcriptional regulator